MVNTLSLSDMAQVRKVPLFEGLSLEDISSLLSHSTVIDVAKNNMLFFQGDEADRFYILLEGRVKLFVTNEEGEESIIEIYNDASSFAEAAMFSSQRFPVNCETVMKSQLVQVDGASFLNVLQENKQICRTISVHMAQRYRSLQNEIIQLKTRSPAERLGVFFLSLVGHDEGKEVVLPYKKSLIAARVGMTPESLSRALARLKDIGVFCQKDNVRVESLQRLQAFCGD